MFGAELFAEHLFAYNNDGDAEKFPTWESICPDESEWDNIRKEVVDTRKCYVDREC